MIQTIVESNMLLYLAVGMGILGILVQLTVSRRYGRLIREAADMQTDRKDFMKQLRYRYRMNQKRSGDQVNLPVFVRRYVWDYKFRRLRLHQWKRLAVGLFLASLAVIACGIGYCLRRELPVAYFQNLLWTALAVGIGSGIAWLWVDFPYKEDYLLTELEDYLCCYGAGADVPEPEAEVAAAKEVKRIPALIGLKKKNPPAETKAAREKRELKANLAKLKESGREGVTVQERERNREILQQMDSQEQERIIRDVLAEFLA